MNKIYLIKSDSFVLLKNKLDEIITDEYEINKFNIQEDTLDDILTFGSYYNFSDKKKCILIRDVKYYGSKFNYEEESNKIYNFCKNTDDLLIIFICDNIVKTKNNTKELISLNAEVIDLSIENDETFNSLILDYCKTKNITIDNNAINKLIENTNKNIDLIIQEIDKISIITNKIDLNSLNQYSYKLNDDDIFKFTGAVINKNYELAFNLLDTYINDGVELFGIVGALQSSFINMYMVKDAMKYGLSDEEIAKVFGYKSTGRIYYLKKDSKIYTLDNLKDIIVSLSDLDLKIKTGYNPVYTFKEFLLNL